MRKIIRTIAHDARKKRSTTNVNESKTIVFRVFFFFSQFHVKAQKTKANVARDDCRQTKKRRRRRIDLESCDNKTTWALFSVLFHFQINCTVFFLCLSLSLGLNEICNKRRRKISFSITDERQRSKQLSIARFIRIVFSLLRSILKHRIDRSHPIKIARVIQCVADCCWSNCWSERRKNEEKRKKKKKTLPDNKQKCQSDCSSVVESIASLAQQ